MAERELAWPALIAEAEERDAAGGRGDELRERGIAEAGIFSARLSARLEWRVREVDQPLRRGHRQRPQDQGVNQRERRNAGAHRQRQ